mgnify:CR=1 FL=1
MTYLKIADAGKIAQVSALLRGMAGRVPAAPSAAGGVRRSGSGAHELLRGHVAPGLRAAAVGAVVSASLISGAAALAGFQASGVAGIKSYPGLNSQLQLSVP